MHRRVILSLPVASSLSLLVGCEPAPNATPESSASGALGSGSAPPPAGAASGDIPAPDDVAAPPADAQKTASGLAYKVLQKGTGTEKPGAVDKVKVHYSGWTKDGKMFDSSHKRKAPASFRLNGVIPGWTEGVQLMVVGEKTRFWIPGNLAYGDTPKRPGAPSGQLTFDIELLEITKAPATPPKPEPIPAPEDVKEPPKDAKKTKSGLSYKVIKKGTGTKKPKESDKVATNYTGWTTDGKMFDTNAHSKKPVEFGVKDVIKGWTEGLQLMVEGETTRFWIPADLAYGEKPPAGAPAGMLVFDVELVKIL